MYRYFSQFPRKRCDVMDEDWDNLLVLDACRYDLFKKVNWVPGTLESRLSRGSNTPEFFEENFKNTTQYDTVYVTANPVPRVENWSDVDVDAIFHDVVDVWEDHWDEQQNTVPPDPVASAIRAAQTNYPNKRIIGHFVQPHMPFIGETGQEIQERGMRAYDKLTGKDDETEKKVWEQLEDGDISTNRVWQAYEENLEIVLPYIEDLCSELSGKTVVTSDHGNLLGEFAWPFPVRKYGHPEGIHTKKLIKVPWLEVEAETRREITPESPVQSAAEVDQEEQLKRLRHLGYR